MASAPAGRIPVNRSAGLSRDGDVGELYDRWSGSYDGDRNRTRDLAGQALRESGLALDARDVAELGCGTGRNTVWLARRARRVVALDLSPGMLAKARERIESAAVGLVLHDLLEPLPLTDRSIDAVVVTLVLEHLESVEPVMAEAARVLRPGGDVLICEYHPFRQIGGGQARFEPEDAGEEVRIPAHLHMVSEYVRAGLRSGLRLTGLWEWFDPEDVDGLRPRILSLSWRKP